MVLEVEQEVEAFVASLQAELEAVARLEEDFGQEALKVCNCPRENHSAAQE
jgi:hypothetical protein